MRRSPVALGIVLGLVAGAVAVAAIALTDSGSGSRPLRFTVAVAAQPPGIAFTPQRQLAALGGRARSYRLGTTPPPGSIERLADAFGVRGPLQEDASGWTIINGRRLLRVERSAGLPWAVSSTGRACVLVPEGQPLSTVPPTGPTACPDAGVHPDIVVSQDDALASGMDTLGRAGLGVSRPVIVQRGRGWLIDAAPLVDGKPTSGFSWTITIGPGTTVAAASGYLARPVAASSYALAGTSEGLRRLQASSPPPPPGQSPTPQPVVDASEGLAFGHAGAAVYLVPAYLFTFPGPAEAPPPFAAVPAVQARYLS